MPEKLLIVNADDLGATVAINDATFALMQQGKVTSATLMAGGSGFEDAVARIPCYPKCSFGVHLCLTQLRPLTTQDALRPILNDNGEMDRRRFNDARLTPALMRAMYDELCAQVDRVLAAGVRISHFDSHHHIHTRPELFPLVKALQLRYAIRRMRGTINMVAGEPISGARALKKNLFELGMRYLVNTRTPEGMGSFMDFHTRLTQGAALPWSTIEIMVHPGAKSEFGVREETLLNGDWASLILCPYRMATFWDL